AVHRCVSLLQHVVDQVTCGEDHVGQSFLVQMVRIADEILEPILEVGILPRRIDSARRDEPGPVAFIASADMQVGYMEDPEILPLTRVVERMGEDGVRGAARDANTDIVECSRIDPGVPCLQRLEHDGYSRLRYSLRVLLHCYVAERYGHSCHSADANR